MGITGWGRLYEYGAAARVQQLRGGRPPFSFFIVLGYYSWIRKLEGILGNALPVAMGGVWVYFGGIYWRLGMAWGGEMEWEL